MSLFNSMFGTSKAEMTKEIESLKSRSVTTQEALNAANARIEEQDETISKLKGDRLQVDEFTQNTNVPTFVLTAQEEEGKASRIKVDMGWNKQFIEQLMKHPEYHNSEDSVIVQKWLVSLMYGLINDIEATIVEDNSKNVGEDYV